jgi:hypothetical protein
VSSIVPDVSVEKIDRRLESLDRPAVTGFRRRTNDGVP